MAEPTTQSSSWLWLAAAAVLLLWWRWKSKKTATPQASTPTVVVQAPPPPRAETPAIVTRSYPEEEPSIAPVIPNPPPPQPIVETPVVTPNPGTSGSSLTMFGWAPDDYSDASIAALGPETIDYLRSHLGWHGTPTNAYDVFMSATDAATKAEARASVIQGIQQLQRERGIIR